MLMFSRKQEQYRQSSWRREHDIELIETRYYLRSYWTEGAKVSDSFWGEVTVYLHTSGPSNSGVYFFDTSDNGLIFQVPYPKCCVHQDGGPWPAGLLLWPSHQSHLPQTCYQGNLWSDCIVTCLVLLILYQLTCSHCQYLNFNYSTIIYM